jgi:hypothetical protein
MSDEAHNGQIINALSSALRGGSSALGEEASQVITEAASENIEKRKRGRPKLYAESREWNIGSEAKTERGKIEACYAKIAAYALFDHRHEHPELTEWTGLYRCDDGKEIIALSSPQFKTTVLAELGRLIERYGNGEEVAVQWSVEILNMKPKLSVKQAMRLLRSWRLDDKRKSTGNSEGFAKALLQAAADYLDTHPDTPNEHIVEGVEMVSTILISDFSPEEAA